MALDLLGGLDAADFLAQYWQKRPLLVRGAFRDFVDPLDQDELAGLAMEEGVRARLIFEKGGTYPWQLKTGPFAEKVLRKLPHSHWTLLVQDVNTYVDEAALLLDRFNFVPNWRADDLMVSFAPERGTVGAHVDSYDVFLIQGQGRRRWQVQMNPDLTLIPNLDVRVLRHFKPEQEWVLEPGDMLYVPPGCAHYGVALENCLTYSVGYRAPQKAELALALLDLPGDLAESVRARLGEALYADSNLTPTKEPGRITPDVVERVRGILNEALADDDLLARWFAGITTKGQASTGAGRAVSPSQVAQRLEKNAYLWRSESERLAYVVTQDESALYLAFSDEELQLPLALKPLLELLCGNRRSGTAEVRAALPRGKARDEGLRLLGTLLGRQILRFAKR